MHTFVVYKSSAGSGKTFTLVKEYLKLALSDSINSPKAYKSILAITFTNKAAAEMKERILNALKNLSSDVLPDNIKTLASILCSELNIEEAELKKRATYLLFDILHNYGNFGVSTIDSFTHSIIRNFSHDIDLPVNFNIETNEEETITKCVDQLIAKIGEDEALTQLVVEFSRTQIDDQKNWQVDENIKTFVGKALKNSSAEKLSLLKSFTINDFKEIRKNLIAKNKNIASVLIEIADEFYACLTSNGINETDFFQGVKGLPGFFKKLKEKNFTDETLHGTYVLNSINEDKWCASKVSKSVELTILSHSGKFRDLYYKASTYLEKQLSDYIINENILKNLYSLSLINEIEKLIEEFKQEENILFISEFNKRIADIISNEPVPFIYEKIGERYKHYLIDEFQDTSSMQWQNLLPLIDNSLAEGNFNLIVGDGKQSIYRWRGGEAEQFEALPKLPYIKNTEMKEMWESTLIRSATVKNLTNNFRSLKNIIEFNNSFFKWLSTQQLKDKWLTIYSSIEQIPQQKNNGGLVSIDIISKDEEDAEKSAFAHLLTYIHKNLALAYRYSDIVVLVRNNGEGDKIADFLTLQNIPVISSDALLLKNCSEVIFMLDVLSFLNQANNAIRASSIIAYLCDNGIISKTKDELLLQLNKGNIKYNLIQLLKNESIVFDVEKLTTMPLLECCIEIMNCFSVTKNKNYLQFFLDEIIAYTAFNSNSISAFLEFWERRGENASLKIPDGSEAIRIMTIHKSKGLEFPVVILPFCNWAIHKPDFLWLDSDGELPMVILSMNKELAKTRYSKEFEEEQQKQLLDSINVLYVAFTRAANHLHIISKETTKQDIFAFIRNYMTEILQLPVSEMHATMGEASENKHSKTEVPVFPYQLSVGNWNRIISIKENNDLLYSSQINENKELGVLIHYILSKIKTKKDIPIAIQQCEQEGLFTTNEAKEIYKELNELLETPAISTFFEEGIESANEQEIITKNGKVLRPDRLLFKNNEAIIVDFKTGKKLSSYDEQLNDYANALLELGYKKTTKYLVYVKEREVVEVV